ncbi:MAG TPA: PHP domain-containing protein [Candidatus Nanoarchaeia archaeon]|nr:PHP domain-containing protein [Candidatus Nanoarchaeia archaeon]
MTHVDLHMHTMYSDGSLDPKSLVRVVKLKNIDVFAITDHDNINGYLRAIDEANKWNIKLIPGVEMTTKDYHILGINFDPENKEFLGFLGYIRDLQRKVCQQRIDKLREYEIPINLEKVERAFPYSRLGKYNILMTMLQDSETSEYINKTNPGATTEDLFDYYLKDKGLAGKIEKKYYIESKEAIEQVHNAGGIAILAHPFRDVKEDSEIEKLLEERLDALEHQPNYNEKSKYYTEYAIKRKIPLTYGSDFHRPGTNRFLLGKEENNIENLGELIDRWK